MRSLELAESTSNGTPTFATPSPATRKSVIGGRIGSVSSSPSETSSRAKQQTAVTRVVTGTPPATRSEVIGRLACSGIARTKTSTAAHWTSPAPRSPAPAARTPLQPRDHNVAAGSRYLKSSWLGGANSSPAQATPSKMPHHANANSMSVRQPQMPALSPAASKALNRAGTPLTPKIANGKQPVLAASVASPLSRRAQRPESAASSTSGIGGGGIQKDEVASPVPAFLANNITPRSGSRQTRVDSANSTPTGTPNPDRSDAWEARSGLGISGMEGSLGGARSRGVTFSPPEPSRPDPDAKFFYASDAKTAQTPLAAQSRPPPSVVQPKGSTFFYANGETIPQTTSPPATASSVFTPVLGGSQENFSSKFVYANGSPDVQATRVFPSSGPSSTVSAAPRLPAVRPMGPDRATALQRPASPVKMAAGQTIARSGTAPQLASSSRQAVSVVTGPPHASTAGLRRTSVDAPSRAPEPHSRSGSLITAEPPTAARLTSQQAQPSPPLYSLSQPPSEVASPVTNRPISTASLTIPTPSHLTDDIASPPTLLPADQGTERDAVQDPLLSPTKSSQAEAQLNDLVANARRERKVQDLEITNASLEAINRTLERQLRKQTHELRRFRRLSRHGRLSLASSLAPGDGDGGAEAGGGGGGHRIVSGSSAGGGALARAGMRLEDLSEDEDELSGDEDGHSSDLDEDTEDTSGSGSASGGAGSPARGLDPREAVLRSERRRRRDERRLQLDLSKHQQLLVDSQKMNQSLKRCLGWTEELIKEGRRALEFKVRVSEVEMGGRVLHPMDEDDADGEGESAEGGYVFEGGGGARTDDEASSSAGDEEKLDRDSAVELHGGDGD